MKLHYILLGIVSINSFGAAQEANEITTPPQPIRVIQVPLAPRAPNRYVWIHNPEVNFNIYISPLRLPEGAIGAPIAERPIEPRFLSIRRRLFVSREEE